MEQEELRDDWQWTATRNGSKAGLSTTTIRPTSPTNRRLVLAYCLQMRGEVMTENGHKKQFVSSVSADEGTKHAFSDDVCDDDETLTFIIYQQATQT